MSQPVTVPGRRPVTDFPALRRLFILPEWKLVYASVPKNACTSIKWVIAELAGEDLDELRRGALGWSPDRDGQIHNRGAWKVLPRAREAAQGVWDEMSAENGWHVFGVIRDPRLRFFSAWQDKYLLQNPGYLSKSQLEEAPPPASPQELIDRFAAFAFETAADPGHPALDDGHFLSQSSALGADVVPFTRLYEMSELGTMMADLNAHLHKQGYSATLTLGRSNKTPFAPCGALFANGVREAVETIYADDFARFGDRWDFRRIEETPVPWTKESFAHAASVIAVHHRLRDIVTSARELRAEKLELRQEAAQLRREVAELRRELDRQRSTASLPGALRRLRRRLPGAR